MMKEKREGRHGCGRNEGGRLKGPIFSMGSRLVRTNKKKRRGGGKKAACHDNGKHF